MNHLVISLFLCFTHSFWFLLWRIHHNFVDNTVLRLSSKIWIALHKVAQMVYAFLLKKLGRSSLKNNVLLTQTVVMFRFHWWICKFIDIFKELCWPYPNNFLPFEWHHLHWFESCLSHKLRSRLRMLHLLLMCIYLLLLLFAPVFHFYHVIIVLFDVILLLLMFQHHWIVFFALQNSIFSLYVRF